MKDTLSIFMVSLISSATIGIGAVLWAIPSPVAAQDLISPVPVDMAQNVITSDIKTEASTLGE